MKIQCDVCNKEEASVFCTADEAALCDTCDHRVHHANKLASKHQRFSLLLPSPKTFPLCDVCQEKRAFLFCQQDRAILCRDCDVPIHTANEHTRKHDRFLLTGVKLSTTSALYASSTATTESSDLVPDSKSKQQPEEASVKELPVSVVSTNCNPVPIAKSLPSNTSVNEVESCSLVSGGQEIAALPSSNISEYLIEMLPGWHVEDFLDPSLNLFGFCKPDGNTLPSVDTNRESNISCFSSENLGGSLTLYPPEVCPDVAFKETSNMKLASRSWADDGFAVPQISFSTTGLKRSRLF
ncbi:hypothetical protein K2173_027789 [Erythroxylum novogranatense]|uniref:B box-type domain-containing protein n=1 Tax=Erythroxylum novogranatense TaxID=1862640 RepID=A0AAV8TZY9_9ROSI|nr:hypothetical protein K2173_027789 [Erythroxylum novogranatense]